MSLYRFREPSEGTFITRGHITRNMYNSIPHPATSNDSERELSNGKRPISKASSNTHSRQRTDARAAYIHRHELEIIRWQARRKSRIEPCQLTCSVCLEYMDPSVWIRPTALCAHEPRICEPCLSQYVEHALREGGLTEVVCPDITCKREMDYEDVILYIRRDAAFLNRYNGLIAQRRLESHPNFVWCTNPECGRGQIHQEGASSVLVTCQYCSTCYCFTHQVAWHDRMTCEEFDETVKQEGQKHASAEYIEKHTKRCPNPSYKRPIEKDTGCDHMTCRRPGGCGHEFCWACLADYIRIRIQGNHLHNPGCRHYARISSNVQATAPEGGRPRAPRRITARAAGRMVLDAQVTLRADQPPPYSANPIVIIAGRRTVFNHVLSS